MIYKFINGNFSFIISLTCFMPLYLILLKIYPDKSINDKNIPQNKCRGQGYAAHNNCDMASKDGISSQVSFLVNKSSFSITLKTSNPIR